MPKNLKETTIVPGQLRHKFYYFSFCRVFQKKKKTILNVKNLENSIKAGCQIRTHDQTKQSSKAFDQSNQMDSMISEKSILSLY
jgi:hypothetical protein